MTRNCTTRAAEGFDRQAVRSAGALTRFLLQARSKPGRDCGGDTCHCSKLYLIVHVNFNSAMFSLSELRLGLGKRLRRGRKEEDKS
ncbi:hypothetical protein E2C01_059783 [Portunus trituberculatus]|uniref:Uncharacterized protein n=1 Tax=Portunus trituberculatus TaxID=210409 RepID=A0A5B7H7L0_PORTR|nr:hypothetical protein [Portunus trituberculatus]